MLRVLFLSKYGERAASCRYRFTQYFPYLKQHDIECTISPLLDDSYLEHKFSTGKSSLIDVTACFFRRFRSIIESSSFDLIVLHCESFPYFPPVFEKIIKCAGIPYIYDYDDAIFHNYDLHPNDIIKLLLKNKLKPIISNARFVLAGNHYLADYANKLNSNVIILPTVVDIDKYLVVDAKQHKSPFTIGWIGSPSTSNYLEDIIQTLDHVCNRGDSVVRLVGAQNIFSGNMNIDVIPWSQKNEVTDIQSFDVGIMPLPDTPWARGKCGFKLIQYMACGLPVVASPVGVNKEIVENGVNGFLATTPKEWQSALEILKADQELRSRMGAAGRKKVEEHYSLQAVADQFVNIIKEAAKK